MKKKKPSRPKLAPPQPSSWMERATLQAAALILLVFVAYSNSLAEGFHFDDQGIFLDPYVMAPGFGWSILRLMQTRPLTFLTFHWNYLGGGNAPDGFHLVNVLLHASNTVFVLLIARRKLSGYLPWLAAALFAIHPLQSQAVDYVFERATLLATFFALLSFLLYLQDRYSWSIAAFGLSLLAKEETIALPAFLLLYDLLRRRPRIPWRYYAGMLGLAGLAAARLFYVLHATPAIGLGFGVKGVSVLSYALTQSRVIWIYLRLFLLPIGLNLEHDVAFSTGLLSPLITLPALVTLTAAVSAVAWLAWRGNESALWALGFFVLLAPSSSVIPVVDPIFEHRVYFPLFCLIFAAALLMARLPPRWRTPLWAGLLVAMLAGTIQRNRAWHDEISLWTDVVEKSPRKALGYFHLAQTYAAAQDLNRARQLYERGLELEPGSAVGHTNLGLVLLSQEAPDAALIHLRRALELGGNDPLVLNNIGAAQLRRGELEDGIQSFRRALTTDPCRFDARVNLMRALSAQGDTPNARLAAQIPETCHLLPEQTQKVAEEQRALQ